MLYHASARPGLEVLEPHVSTHDCAYVYAIRGRITAACFGAPKDDFDLLMDEETAFPACMNAIPMPWRRSTAEKAVHCILSVITASWADRPAGTRNWYVIMRFR